MTEKISVEAEPPVSEEDIAWAKRQRKAHYIDHAPSKTVRPYVKTIAFERCEAFDCEEAREILGAQTTPTTSPPTKTGISDASEGEQ